MNSVRTLRCLSTLNSVSFAQIRRNPDHKDGIKRRRTLPTAKLCNMSDEMRQFISSSEYDYIRDLLPKYLLKKYKTPESMYLINRNTALNLLEVIDDKLGDDVLVEVNPGFGVLTEEILKTRSNDMHLFELLHHYPPFIEELQKKYPGRIKYKMGDFFGMWKLAFRDKLDNGTRLQDLLQGLTDEIDKGRNIKVLGTMPSLNFIKHLIYTETFNNSGNLLKKPELYTVISEYNLEYLKNSGSPLKPLYRIIPSLFGLLFDYEVLGTLPRAHYLPWIYRKSIKNESVLIDDEKMLLVKIVYKEKLPCKEDYLPLLWFFLKPSTCSRKNRIIPTLEQWVPGAGVWLITGQDPPGTRRELSPGPEDEPLPYINIFTQFGDLTIHQKVTVFKRFVSWPEFEQCPFRVNMENNLPRSIAAMDKDHPGTALVNTDEIGAAQDVDDHLENEDDESESEESEDADDIRP